MGTSQNTAQLVGKIEKYAYSLGKANRNGVSAAALRYKEQLLRNAEKVAGPDRRLSNWKARYGLKKAASPRLNAGYKLFGYTDAKAYVKPSPYGIWSMLEGGAKAHIIRPFRYVRGRRKGEGNSALAFPGAGQDGRGFATFAEHPGTKPTFLFTSAAKIAEPSAVRSFQRSHHAALLDVFR